MKKSALFSVIMALIIAMSFNASADDNKKDRKERPKFTPEQMATMRAQRIAENLKLDDATTNKFVETYKAYLNEQHEIFAKYGKEMKEGKKGDKKQKTDAEVEKEILDQIAMSRAQLDLREKYYKKFRTFLNPKQIKAVYNQEKKNMGKMRDEKSRRGGQPGMDGKPGNGQMPPMPQPKDGGNYQKAVN